MKNILVLITLFFISFGNIFATNSCNEIKREKVSFIGEISSGVNVRNGPCSYNSSIIKTALKGESYSVVSKVDGWYEIILENGQTGWIWDKMIKNSGSKFTKKYVLKQKDRILINKINYKIQKLIDKKGVLYRDKFVNSLNKSLKKSKKYSRQYEIIEEILKNTQKVSFLNLANNHYKEYKIDIDKIKKTWLDWHNAERKSLGLKPYSYNTTLDNTAFEWSTISSDKGVMEHKRHYYDDYYDYKVIESWFQERGVKCKVINGTTSSESIGQYGYYCKDGECTDEIIESLKAIYDIYMAEKGQAYDAHYRAIVHKDITKIGIGIRSKKTSEKDYYDFYVTTHYCTEFVD